MRFTCRISPQEAAILKTVATSSGLSQSEYVLSPSPDDRATPVQVCDFAQEWAARNFPNCEVAIIVHIDNKERIAQGKELIPHAHVYVNAPDLATGKKVQLSNVRVRELHDSAQRMCADRGWSAQAEYWDKEARRVRHLDSERTDFERRPQWQRSVRKRRGRRRTWKLEPARGETPSRHFRAEHRGTMQLPPAMFAPVMRLRVMLYVAPCGVRVHGGAWGITRSDIPIPVNAPHERKNIPGRFLQSPPRLKTHAGGHAQRSRESETMWPHHLSKHVDFANSKYFLAICNL